MSDNSTRDDTLQCFEDCGAAEMPIAETCIIAQMTEAEYLADKEAQARYLAGQLKTKLAVRQSVVKMAKEGVPQMVKIYLDFNLPTTAPQTEAQSDIPSELNNL